MKSKIWAKNVSAGENERKGSEQVVGWINWSF